MLASRKRSKRRVDTLSPWVSLVEVAVRRDGESVETYHGLEVADYAVVCASSSPRPMSSHFIVSNGASNSPSNASKAWLA